MEKKRKLYRDKVPVTLHIPEEIYYMIKEVTEHRGMTVTKFVLRSLINTLKIEGKKST